MREERGPLVPWECPGDLTLSAGVPSPTHEGSRGRMSSRACPPCQPSRADPADELQTEEYDEEGLDASLARSAGTPQDEGEEGNDVPFTRNWHYRLVMQKTLTGEIALRKWVTDQSPQYVARRGVSELQSHLCSFHDCGKAFPDASALRKHMHTHGEKQYVCQVEVRRPTRFRRVALAY